MRMQIDSFYLQPQQSVLMSVSFQSGVWIDDAAESFTRTTNNQKWGGIKLRVPITTTISIKLLTSLGMHFRFAHHFTWRNNVEFFEKNHFFHLIRNIKPKQWITVTRATTYVEHLMGLDKHNERESLTELLNLWKSFHRIDIDEAVELRTNILNLSIHSEDEGGGSPPQRIQQLRSEFACQIVS